jgi:hypothetical protein
MSGLGVEQDVITAFLDTLRQSKDEPPAALISELATHLAAGGPDAKTVVELVSRLAGDSSA